MSGQSSSNVCTIDALDSVIRDHAFEALKRHRTGVVYGISLPANLSGMAASVLRMRSRSLWREGANFTAFHVPRGTIVVPHVRRLIVVYQDWGKWSASCYNVRGFELVTPVIGFLAYDASDPSANSTTELNFTVAGVPISISFPGVVLPTGSNSTAKCARFETNGTVHLGDVASTNACTTRSTGHFAIVVPLEEPDHRGKEKRWIWLAAIVGGVVGLGLVGLIARGMFEMVKKRRREEMVKQAEEGEALEATWIGRSRMPSAAMMIRTQPVLEDEGAP